MKSLSERFKELSGLIDYNFDIDEDVDVITGALESIEKQVLSDEEVWLRAFEAAMGTGRVFRVETAIGCADDALAEFRKRFRSQS